MFRHQKLIARCSAVLFAFALAGCSSSSDNQMSEPTEPTEPTGPTPAEQELAALQAEFAALRQLLGIDDNNDVGDAVDDLQNAIETLKAQIQAVDDAAAEAAAKARTAELNALASGISAAGGSSSGDRGRVRADRDKPDNAEDLDAPASISGWSGASWSADGTVAVVYTNQGSPVPTPFNQKWGNLDNETEAERDGVYELFSATHGELVDIPGMPTNANHPGVAVGPVQGLRGTFDGVPGTFKGDGDTGTVVGVNAAGNASWAEAGTDSELTFTPDSNTATVAVRDSSYLNLGYWLTTADDGAIKPEVAAWASAGLDAYNGLERGGKDFQNLIGKATFEGIAVGQYTSRSIDSIEGGAFNADATFDVDFGTDSENGGVTGTLDGFMSNGEPLGSSWKVVFAASRVGNAPFDADARAEPDDAAAGSGLVEVDGAAQATVGTMTFIGDWQADFLDGSRNDDMPGAIAGDFRITGGSSRRVYIMGAFGAINQVADQPDD